MNCLGEKVDSKEQTELLHRFDNVSKKLIICRGKTDSEAEEDPCELLNQVATLIENWQGELPDLKKFFCRDDIDWLLTLAMKDIRASSHYRRGRRIIDFVVRSGYRDEPDLDENGKPSSRRTTPIHSIRRSNWLDLFMSSVENLFKIYDRFDVNYIDEFGCSHFHVACEYECTDAVKKFLELGHDPNLIEEESGESLLYMAVKHSSHEVIEVLFKRGANPILANRDGKTPLQIHGLNRLFFKMNKRICQRLRVNARDNLGRTPLQSALVCGHKKTVKWLLKLGADPNSANEWGWTPLHIICHREYLYSGYNDWAELFFKICDKLNQPVRIDARNKLGQTPLHLAMCHRKKMFELLLRRGADPNLADNEGLTPLHVINTYNDGTVELFFKINDELNQQVRVNVWDKKGHSPLQLAFLHGNKKTAETLLRRGADPNLANEDGSTLLHSICQTYFQDNLAKMLFEIGDELNQVIQVDAKDKLGRTPLQLAVANLKPKSIDVLLDRGADLSSFVFPNESNFDDCFEIYIHTPIQHKLIFACGLMAVVERLEARGYELDRGDALTVMKLFAKYGLFEKPINRAKCWHDEKFATEAKEKIVNSSLSLYDLIRLRPEEAEKRHTHLEFFELLYSRRWFFFRTEESCVLHLCEKLSRGFFRRCAIYPFWELIHHRLPIKCCEMILQPLMNKDLYHICLAVTGQS